MERYASPPIRPMTSRFPSVIMAVVLLFGLLPGAARVHAAANSDTTWFMNAKYGVFNHFLPGWNDITGDATGVGSPTSWDTTVNGFDTATYASQISQTGAKYVIFTLGQNSGFYCAPNSYYTSLIGAEPGQYCSTRDLISDLYDALNPLGIKLIVYVPSLGPTAAPDFIMEALQVDSTAGNPTFRAEYNLMIATWSCQWGSKVAGWWLDDTFPYRYPEDESDGLQNLNDLVASCKAGNANAIVACNTSPVPLTYGDAVQTTNQDYVAGESYFLWYFPRSRYISYTDVNGTVNVQWHALLHLGTDWGEPSTRFANDQLADYIYYSNQRQGVVTMDTAIYADGHLSPAQLAQWVAVKPILTGAAPPTPYMNLALYKPAWLMSNLGAYQLPVNAITACPNFALLDNLPVTNPSHAYARAGGEWAWNLEVDLGAPVPFKQAVVTFPNQLVATSYKIESSTNQTTWTQRAAGTAPVTGGTFTSNFATTTARYVRVKAITPNGPDQPGTQMAIYGLQIYGPVTVPDFSFETPAMADNTYAYSPAGAAWSWNGDTGIINHAAIWGAPVAPNGSQVAFLQLAGSFSQAVDLPGGSHTLSFYSAQRPGNTAPQNFRVEVDGVTVGTFTPSGVNRFRSYTTGSFTVTPGSHTIAFAGNTTSGDCTAFIDRVVVN